MRKMIGCRTGRSYHVLHVLARILIIFLAEVNCSQFCGKRKDFTISPPNKTFIELGKHVQVICRARERLLELVNNRTCDIKFEPQFWMLKLTQGTKPEVDLPLVVGSKGVRTNMSMGIPGDYRIYCFYNGSYVRFTRLVAKNIPRPEKISCFSDNLRGMSCTFTLSKEQHVAPMKWTMEFRRTNYGHWASLLDENCIVETQTCHWSPMNEGSGIVFQILEMYQIRVTVISRFGNHTARVAFSSWDIVKPDPISNLTYNEEDNQLTWTLPGNLERHSDRFQFSVNISSDIGDVSDTLDLMTSETRVTLPQMIPYFQYIADIRCKSKKAEDSDLYWSNTTRIHFWTPQDIPRRSVVFTVGSYTLVNCGTKNLCPIVYWQNPGPRYRSGPLIRYRITIQSINDTRPTHNIHEQSFWTQYEVTGPTETVAIQRSLKKNLPYKAIVRVATEIGLSEPSVPLSIPSYMTSSHIKPTWVVIEVDNENKVRMSWATGAEVCADVTTVTFYTCRMQAPSIGNLTDYINCLDLVWATLDINENCDLVNRKWMTHAEGYVYAVSLATEDGNSGGMVWQSHVFEGYGAAPARPHYTVQGLLLEEADGNHAVINVTVTYSYNSVIKGGIPEVHHVFYVIHEEGDEEACPADGKVETVMADFSRPYIILTDVTPGSQYIVCVRSSNEAGSSVFGKPVLVSLHGDADPASLIAVGGVTGVLVLVLLVLLIYIAVKKWNRFMNKGRIINADVFEEVVVTFLDTELKEKRNVDDEKSFRKRQKTESGDSGTGASLSLNSESASIHSTQMPETDHYVHVDANDVNCRDDVGYVQRQDKVIDGNVRSTNIYSEQTPDSDYVRGGVHVNCREDVTYVQRQDNVTDDFKAVPVSDNDYVPNGEQITMAATDDRDTTRMMLLPVSSMDDISKVSRTFQHQYVSHSDATGDDMDKQFTLSEDILPLANAHHRQLALGFQQQYVSNNEVIVNNRDKEHTLNKDYLPFSSMKNFEHFARESQQQYVPNNEVFVNNRNKHHIMNVKYFPFPSMKNHSPFAQKSQLRYVANNEGDSIEKDCYYSQQIQLSHANTQMGCRTRSVSSTSAELYSYSDDDVEDFLIEREGANLSTDESDYLLVPLNNTPYMSRIRKCDKSSNSETDIKFLNMGKTGKTAVQCSDNSEQKSEDRTVNDYVTYCHLTREQPLAVKTQSDPLSKTKNTNNERASAVDKIVTTTQRQTEKYCNKETEVNKEGSCNLNLSPGYVLEGIQKKQLVPIKRLSVDGYVPHPQNEDSVRPSCNIIEIVHGTHRDDGNENVEDFEVSSTVTNGLADEFKTTAELTEHGSDGESIVSIDAFNEIEEAVTNEVLENARTYTSHPKVLSVEENCNELGKMKENDNDDGYVQHGHFTSFGNLVATYNDKMDKDFFTQEKVENMTIQDSGYVPHGHVV